MYKSPNLVALDGPLDTRDVANKIEPSLWVYIRGNKTTTRRNKQQQQEIK